MTRTRDHANSPTQSRARSAEALDRAARHAASFLGPLPERPVAPSVDLGPDELRDRLGGPMPERGEDPVEVIDTLVAAADPGLVASPGPRYFGFVTGGALPAAVAAEWLASAWDQNAAMYVGSPAAATVEVIAAGWLVDLLGLPAGTSVGFTTGATAANVTGLAAARHAVLRAAGWDVEADGLQGAPAVRVIVGDDAHTSLLAALRLVGLGRDRATRVETDEAGRMRPDALREAVAAAGDGALVVCAQAGEVNTGASDPFSSIADILSGRPATWLHVDGAFGLWIAASPRLRPQLRGHERADSWATDAHKWLNVPYDSGLVFVRDAAAHRAAMSMTAAYLVPAPGSARDPFDWVPEASRRARGLAVYAALRSLGRRGVADMVERCAELASRFAARLAEAPDVAILNEVVLNQVLVRFSDDDAVTIDTIARVQADGTCWAGGTTWRGKAAMRISVSNWSTTEADIDVSAEAIRRCHRAVVAARAGG